MASSSRDLGSPPVGDGADKLPHIRPCFSVTDAIYAQGTVRDFTPQLVPGPSIHALLYAAVQAPSVQLPTAYAFAIVQGRQTLAELSDWSAQSFDALGDQSLETPSLPGLMPSAGDDSNIFYNASTLIVVLGAYAEPNAVANIWLAAGNLVLAACGMGLGTRIVVKAVEALNSPEWRRRMRIPPHLHAIAPILVGVPHRTGSEKPRKAPDILSWLA